MLGQDWETSNADTLSSLAVQLLRSRESVGFGAGEGLAGSCCAGAFMLCSQMRGCADLFSDFMPRVAFRLCFRVSFGWQQFMCRKERVLECRRSTVK